jgi:uncharacterized protein YuzE
VRFSYYPDTDTLYIDLLDRPGADVLEVAADFVVDVDSGGRPVGIELEHASERIDLSKLEVEGLHTSLSLERAQDRAG